MTDEPREIPLTRGYVAIVDAEDYDRVTASNWHVALKPSYGPYAHRHVRLRDGRRTKELMHRYLLPGVVMIDHVNGNGLDNRRANLRPATDIENSRNRSGLGSRNTSGYRGVHWDSHNKIWRARIFVEFRPIHLGHFTDPADAARAFDAAAIELFGEFHGYLNFPAGVQ